MDPAPSSAPDDEVDRPVDDTSMAGDSHDETLVWRARPRGLVAAVRRFPFTLSVVGVMLVLAVVTGTLWSSLEDRALFHHVGYGLPAFQQGRWYTVVTGALFALTPLEYLAVAGGFLLLAGFCEWWIGSRRTAVVVITGQVVGILGAALIVRLLVPTGWSWAIRISDDYDVGFSAGAVAALAAATAAMPAPWRARTRVLLGTYCAVSLLYIGVLWDLEHALAASYGFLIGPALIGRPYRWGIPKLTRHEWRILAAGAFILYALIQVVLFFVPADGPLGAQNGDNSGVGLALSVGVALLLAIGLRRGRRAAWRWALGITAFVVTFSVTAFVVWLAAPPDSDISIGGSEALPDAVVATVLWTGQLVILILGRNAFRSPGKRRLRRKGIAGTDDHGQAVELLRRDGGTTLSWMTTWPANRWFFPTDPGDSEGAPLGYQAFQVHRGMTVALGDPIGADFDCRSRVLDEFVDFNVRHGLPVCLFSVTDETASWAEGRRWQTLRVAEEAVVDLPGLEFKGKAWQDVRTALNRAAKEGVTFRTGPLAEMPRGQLVQVRAISETWVGDKGLPEMGFTLGGIDEALDPSVRVGLAIDADGTVHGVTSWLPVYDPGGSVAGWTLDVMRRLPDGFRPVTEFLIASSCLAFKEQGCRFVSLSGAPLAHAGERDEVTGLEKLLDSLGQALEPVYGFQSLEAFKAKFQPRHRDLWLVYADEAMLPRIGLALTRAYLPDASIRELAVAGLQTARS